LTVHVALRHVTHYKYDRAVALGPQIVRLRPAPHSPTPVLGYALKVTPADHAIDWQCDAHGNQVAHLTFAHPADELTIEVELTAAMTEPGPAPQATAAGAGAAPVPALAPYLHQPPATARLQKYLETLPRHTTPPLDFVAGLAGRLRHELRYLVREAPGVQTPEETLERASGSCRDFAWLLVQLLRRRGLAARFVSGYLIHLEAGNLAAAGAAGNTADLHAWCEVYLPDAGWVGVDPSMGGFAGAGYIPLAVGATPEDTAPVTGYTEKSGVELGYEMRVMRLAGTPGA
jgi:transglutaminase-like putative cysteine protease